jgi:hypothetical protein
MVKLTKNSKSNFHHKYSTETQNQFEQVMGPQYWKFVL